MRNVVIAPTKDLYRDPAQKEINDHVKDQTDAVNLEEKIPGKIVPKTVYSTIPRNTEGKRYHDMRPIHLGNAIVDAKARRNFANFEREKWGNGVAFPNVGQKANECFLKRDSGDCMQQS